MGVFICGNLYILITIIYRVFHKSHNETKTTECYFIASLCAIFETPCMLIVLEEIPIFLPRFLIPLMPLAIKNWIQKVCKYRWYI